ncbi:MAG: hypothetical protein RLZZ293_573 [Pseudomonadota bacterium]|jgi:abortive infection bacteriophage resistance protein
MFENKDINSEAVTNIYQGSPSSVVEQIAILQQRGMIIDNFELANKFLEEVYFHRFLSYSVPFFAHTNGKKYIPNTHFKQVVQIYKFDSKLRILLLDVIEIIEISIRTQFIKLSWKYGPHFYSNHKLFYEHKQLNDTLERLQYQLKNSQDLLIYQYYTRYNYPELPPVWVAMELFTIGQLVKLIANLKHLEDRNSIAEFYHLPYSVFIAVLDNLTLIRNNCAHHARIWNQHFTFNCAWDSDLGQKLEHLCQDGKIYSILLLITHLLSSLEVNKANQFVQNLTNLITKYQVNVELMGFSPDWQTKFHYIMEQKYAFKEK